VRRVGIGSKILPAQSLPDFCKFVHMRKYPIGLQEFRKIREGGYIYVDKTQLIHNLIESGSYYFLSRPRRFGKSLLLSIVKEIFSGSRELFKGLWIEDNWNWEQRLPVIHLAFSQIAYKEHGLAKAIDRELELIAQQFGVTLEGENIKEKFRELIRKVAGNGKVVILIDEYDKPIIDFLENLPVVQENREVFKSFYSVLKDSDKHVHLLLITGVSKFSKVSIFSDLNNLNDITIHPRYSTLVGITQQELETSFAPEIRHMQQSMPAVLDKIKEWYNGYSWFDGKETVYNPFSLLSLMEAGVFRNFWFQTGTPTFLIQQIKKKREFRFEGIRLGEITLGNFDPANISPAPLLFQTGYLTIKRYDPDSHIYELDYPNKEVESSLLDGLLSAYREVFPNDSMAWSDDLKEALRANDIERVIALLNDLIVNIPYDHWKADKESIFHIVVYLAFRKVGIDVNTEVHSAKGRADVLVQTATHIYVIELKLDTSAKKALEQVLKKDYLMPFKADNRKKIAIGINFSSKDRMVKDYELKEVTPN
jgi:hypothetical protein